MKTEDTSLTNTWNSSRLFHAVGPAMAKAWRRRGTVVVMFVRLVI